MGERRANVERAVFALERGCGMFQKFSPTLHDLRSLAWLNDYFQVAFDETNPDSIWEAEFEPICRKLNLIRDQKLLDIGGELLIYAARKHGSKVVGLTLDRLLQLRLNQFIAASGLLGSAVKFMDCRNFVSVKFDKAVHLNPFTTVQQKEMLNLFGTVFNLLRPGGLFLTQCIATVPPTVSASVQQQTWLARSIDSILHPSTRNKFLPFSEVELIANQIGFEIHLVEDLSETYRIRLRYWQTYLQANQDSVVSDISDAIFHAGNASLSILLDRIESGHIGVYQCVLSKPTNGRNHLSLPDSQRCCGIPNSE